MKKFLSILLAAMLVLGMASAFADTVDNTLDNQTEGHTYAAYQIFAGTQAASDVADGIIGITSWGEGVDAAQLVTDFAATDATFAGTLTDKGITAEKYDDAATAIVVADYLAANQGAANAFAKVAHKNKTNATVESISTETPVKLPVGYYLLVDTTTFDDPTDTYINASLLQTVVKGDLTIQQKNSIPTVVKKIYEEQDEIAWNDNADYDIGDYVPFKITGTLPDDLDIYASYQVIFTDTMDAGLTYQGTDVADTTANEAIKVYVLKGDQQADITANVNISGENQSLVVTVADLKALTLTDANGNAVVLDNTCKVVVEYYARLNEAAKLGNEGNFNKVYMEYSNNPNSDGEGDLGKTPEDKVVAFTFELKVNKIDASTETTKLDGAKFKMQSVASGKWVKTVVDNIVTEWTNDEALALELETANGGVIALKGLDDGKYNLKETVAPAGYSLPANPVVVITLTGVQTTYDANAAAKNNTFTGPDALPKVMVNEVESNEVNVKNTKGGTLPETGGIGTTIFYLLGSIMFIGAAMTLVVRRRADAEEV